MEIPAALPEVTGPAPAAAIGGVSFAASAPAVRLPAGTPPTVARPRLPRPGPAAAR